ncbi:hypothetical protein ABW19_dt0206538 [Dactylella cylindrospora]|nr:hypothetical protein ABW19_dt0206538 [Dactylella cylindrospora]
MSTSTNTFYQPTESQTFSLPDGRTLGYAEYGYPNGYPVFFFHGFPSSRIEGYPLDKLAHRLRLRIISLDRPGFGLSTFQPYRRILDWPADVEAFARHSGLRRFAIMGASGGGPYAIACAKELPKGMLSAVGVFAGGPPWEAGRQYMPWFARWSAWAVNFWRGGFAVLARGFIGFFGWLAQTGPMSRQLDKFLESAARKAKESPSALSELGMRGSEDWTSVERRKRLLGLLLSEPFAQGVEGFVQETKLLSDNGWGFKFEDVDYGPIKIWHGAKDTNAPIQMIRYMANRLPNATLTEFDDTHFTMAQHFPKAFSELVSEEEMRKHNEGL